ncbi:MAG: alpha/beta hydrolase [Acidobacteriota bacterium]|nr:alpha/beta hydrolase [Acidobacteriota bacterium]
MEPISHFFYSDRLKLQFWDWGTEGKPALILVHGGLDHARNWDWVAKAVRDDYHVYALDLRGHGNSAWAPGALYSIAEHILDLSVLADIINQFPLRIVGHSLGAITALLYAGVFPERVAKLVAIEGLGLPLQEARYTAPERIRRWIEKVRAVENRTQHSYPNLEAAVARMKEANPFLSDDVAKHLTLHGTNWNADGSIIWKFDNYARLFPPYGANPQEAAEILRRISCPTLLFWGRQSFAKDPETDPLAQEIANRRIIKVDQAGHWLHHDQLEIFLCETKKFLAE